MRLEQRGLDVAYRTYPGMGHRILPDVIKDARNWLEQ
jgi:predicted esterase